MYSHGSECTRVTSAKWWAMYNAAPTAVPSSPQPGNRCTVLNGDSRLTSMFALELRNDPPDRHRFPSLYDFVRSYNSRADFKLVCSNTCARLSAMLSAC